MDTNRNTEDAVMALLGGAGVLNAAPRDFLAWIDLIRAGIPYACVSALANNVGMAPETVATAIGLSPASLAGKKAGRLLTPEQSAKLNRLARVMARALDVFEANEPAITWLKSPNLTLRGTTPLSLLDTEIGADNVMRILGRIEYGICV